jgi:DNA-binding transcriptional LysR family regulator
LSPAVANFTQVHPGTRVEMFDLSAGEMLAGLEAGKLDVAVTARPHGETRGLQWTTLVSSPWRLAVHLKHPLARGSKVKPADVVREPLLVYSKDEYPEYWDTITGWLKENGVRARIAGEYNGIDSLFAAVASGLGVALVVARTAHLFPTRVRMKILTAAPQPLCIAAGHRADRSADKPLAVFIGELQRAANGAK